MASQGGSSCSFKDWLTGYLNDWGLDGEVYGEYISGTFESLEDNATIEEEQAALADVLDGLVVIKICVTQSRDYSGGFRLVITLTRYLKLYKNNGG